MTRLGTLSVLFCTIACSGQLGDGVPQGGGQAANAAGSLDNSTTTNAAGNSQTSLGNTGTTTGLAQNGNGALGTNSTGSGDPNGPSGSGSNSSGIGGAGTSGSSSSSGSGASSDASQIQVEQLANCSTPGPRQIRRLTAKQYDNTLAALLGSDAPTEVVLSDPAVLGFHIDADALLVTDLTGELLMNHAESVAAWAIENHLWDVTPCNSHDEGCHRQFIDSFGRKAFRMPPTDQQMNTYLAMFAAEDSFEAGLQVVLSTMLQSPYLLYRQELGEQDPGGSGEYQLTQFEIATQLAYFLTDSPPDQQLIDAATQNRLQTNDQLDQQVYRLLSQPAAQDILATFAQGWVEVDELLKKAKDTNVFDLTPELRQAMLDETRNFFLDALQSGGTIADLFTAQHTFVNGPLANFYGISGVNGDSFQRTSLDGSTRTTGMLGQAAFLTEHALPDTSSPVQRGVVVRKRLLCQTLPPVPQGLNTNLATPDAFATNRERYLQHSQDAACSGCHATIDPIGFAFENYDAFGRYQSEDKGTPIDATGELADVIGGPVPLDGLQSLSDFLGQSEEARSCLIRYWTYFAYGRDTWDNKQCNHDAIRKEAASKGNGLQDTLLAIVHAPHFTRRVAD